MRPYEVAIILDASLDDTIIRQTTDGIIDFVKSKGGTPGRVDRWGRRAFAYEMKKRTEGYYLFVDVTGEPAASYRSLDRMLTPSDDVLRHRVIRLPEGDFGRREVRSPREVAPVVEAPAAVASRRSPRRNRQPPEAEPEAAPVAESEAAGRGVRSAGRAESEAPVAESEAPVAEPEAAPVEVPSAEEPEAAPVATA